MKRKSIISTLFAGIVICLSFAAHAAPPFVTPAMMKRNGLTDEQYELLWKQGKNPQIDIATARDWIFRASRYTNVVEWLEICGRTNDFAKLSHKLQGDNFVLSATNSAMRTEIKNLGKRIFDLDASAAWWKYEYDNATNRIADAESRIAAASNTLERIGREYDMATNAWASAEARVERLDMLRNYLVEQKNKALLDSTKKFYQALIDRIDGE